MYLSAVRPIQKFQQLISHSFFQQEINILLTHHRHQDSTSYPYPLDNKRLLHKFQDQGPHMLNISSVRHVQHQVKSTYVSFVDNATRSYKESSPRQMSRGHFHKMIDCMLPSLVFLKDYQRKIEIVTYVPLPSIYKFLL